MPFAYDNRYRKKLIINNKKLNKKILFYGSWDKNREKILNRINSKNIDIFGNGWQNASHQFKKNHDIFFKDIYGSELAKKIRIYSACLNLNRPQVKDSHNMRLFEVTGYCGLIITPETKETKIFFKNKNSIIMFKNFVSLKKILKNDFTNQYFLKLRNKSFILSKNHSYDKRSLQILKTISNVIN